MKPDGLLPIEYRDGDRKLHGYLGLPAATGPHPGVLVCHHGLGLGEQAFDRVHKLAALGYAAFAVDLFGIGIRRISQAESMEINQSQGLSNPARLRKRILAGHQAMVSRPEVDATRLGAIGFCLGGLCVLELARMGADVKAVASYHGVLSTQNPAQPGMVKAKVAVFTGLKDPYARAADVAGLRAEMCAAGADWQITEYGEGYHAFTGPRDDQMEALPGMKYDPMLDAMSWASTLAMFSSVLRPN